MFFDRKGKACEKPNDIIPKKRESGYGVFIKDNKVFLVKPSWNNLFEFPGGGKELNESLIEALKREFKEETGSDIIEFEEEPFHSINTKFYADDIDEYFDSTMFFFKINKISERTGSIDEIEIVEIKTIALNDLNKENTRDYCLEVLKIKK